MPAFAAAIALLCATPAAAEPGTTAIERARSWVEAGVGYSGGATFTNEYGTYRTDCSGYVSMALGLESSYTTGTLETVSYAIPKDALEPGDLINNPAPGASGHVVLFAGWADDARTRYYAYEESPSGGAHFSEIPFPYWPGYGTFTPRRYVGTTATVAQPPVTAEPELPVVDEGPSEPPPLVDGVFVRHDRKVYQIAGGAALPATLKSPQRLRKLSDGEFEALAARPADGTFLRTRGTKQDFVVVGGAPVYVPPGSLDVPTDVVKVRQDVLDETLARQPADGTVVKTERGEHYVFAGGAPIHMTDQWRKDMRPRPSATEVPQLALDLAGGWGAWSHVRNLPADDTLIKADASVYRIVDGVPVPHHGVRGVPVDPEALANAGEEGPWSHLVSPDQ